MHALTFGFHRVSVDPEGARHVRLLNSVNMLPVRALRMGQKSIEPPDSELRHRFIRHIAHHNDRTERR